MTNLRGIGLKPTKRFHAGRSVLDCSGPIHGSWIEHAAKDDHLKVVVYRSDFRAEEIDLLPRHEGVQLVSGNLKDVLARSEGSVSLLIDDLGALHFNDEPLELLKRYYDALAWDGEAWIRFPKSFWVFQEDSRRISLQDYMASKFPSLSKTILPIELDPLLAAVASSSEGWVLLKKDKAFPKLFFHLQPRTLGGTSCPAGSPHAPYLEFVERKASVEATAFRRVG